MGKTPRLYTGALTKRKNENDFSISKGRGEGIRFEPFERAGSDSQDQQRVGRGAVRRIDPIGNGGGWRVLKLVTRKKRQGEGLKYNIRGNKKRPVTIRSLTDER